MQPVKSLGPRVLSGRHVRLEPLAAAHREGVRAAASDPSLWDHGSIDGAADFDGWWQTAERDVASGGRMAFAVVAGGAIVGSTSYMAIVPKHGCLEIGWTFYARASQGTVVNPEAKFLLLENAFACGYHRVELRTSTRNAQSRAAITKLGAREDGILRGNIWLARGAWRDTIVYSILADEWAGVREKLEQRLGGSPAGG